MLHWLELITSNMPYLLTALGIGAAAWVILIYVPKPFRKWAWSAVAIIGAVILLNLAWGDVKASLIAQGDKQCENRHKVDQADKDKAVRKKQDVIRDKAEKRKAAIYEQDNDRPVGPLLNDYFNGLR